jgi:hypothetical protein
MLLIGAGLSAAEWDPVDPADLAATESAIEADAEAEYIFYRRHIEDTSTYGITSTSTYTVRKKIFTAQGAKNHSKVRIYQFGYNPKIKGLEARIIRPDGSIEELDEEELLQKEVSEITSDYYVTRDYSLPDVSPGSILDYRFEVSATFGWPDQVIPLQGEIPIRQYRLEVHPVTRVNYYYSLYFRKLIHRAPQARLEELGRAAFVVTLDNIPSRLDEPHAVPLFERTPVVHCTYTGSRARTAEDFWGELARIHNDRDKAIHAGKPVRNKAAELVKGSSTNMEKARRLYTFCQSGLRNTADNSKEHSEKELEQSGDMSPQEVLKKGFGNPEDIRRTYIALCKAAGLDARTILLPDNQRRFFNPQLPDEHALPYWGVAVSIDGRWVVCRPGQLFVPFGITHRREAGMHGIIASKKEAAMIQVPLLPHADNRVNRLINLSLDEDGALSGEVQVDYHGYRGIERRGAVYDQSPDEQLQILQDELSGRFPGIEIDGVTYENITRADEPLRETYRVVIPHYAVKAGSRLVLQPCVSQYGVEHPFKDNKRTHLVYLPAGVEEQEEIRIRLPEGYALESPTRPVPVENDLFTCRLVLSYAGEQHTLVAQHECFRAGLLVPKENYPSVKRLFDEAESIAAHQVVLKRTD